MGVELKKAAQKTFKKHTDTALRDVVNGDLFDQSPAACPRRFLGNPTNASSLNAGDDVKLEFDGDALIGTRGITKVLEANNPPPDVVEYVRQRSGLAPGTIANVNPLSGTVEIDLC